MQIEEKTPAPVKQAKKEASAMAEKVTEKVSKMAAPVPEAAVTKRVSVTRQGAPIHPAMHPAHRGFAAFAFGAKVNSRS